MKLKKIAATGLTLGVLSSAFVAAGAANAFASTPAPSTSSSTCLPSGHDDRWPLWTDGNPGRNPGVTVYHDAHGWHVRVTHNSLHDRVFTGEIATTGTLENVKGVGLEKNDSLKVGPDGHGLVFKFNNYGHVDGIDFTTKCAPALEFGFKTDGHVLPTKYVAIGVTSRHPANDPFVIKRLP
jgi:hypothetical protein